MKLSGYRLFHFSGACGYSSSIRAKAARLEDGGSNPYEWIIELLKEAGFRSAIVLLDAGSVKAERKLVHRISRAIFVRTVSLPDGEDPATVSEDFLREHVPVLSA